MTNLSTVTKKLEETWREIQSNWPTVRHSIIVIYRHKKGNKQGHFHANQWHANDDKVDEVFVNSLTLKKPIEKILRVLLHEAVHSRAEAEEIKDTSRGGSYHNKRFKALAEEMGLVVEKDARAGYTTTGLQDGIFDLYKGVLPTWDETQRLYQEQKTGNSLSNRNTSLRLECSCGRILRMSRKSFDAGGVGCLSCGEEFVLSV